MTAYEIRILPRRHPEGLRDRYMNPRMPRGDEDEWRTSVEATDVGLKFMPSLVSLFRQTGHKYLP